ncbi:hypothetical protein FEM48_Zijuj01G0288000 [Ziziphus jujuba var. spinosa]|uniref:Uncharacterized protein n=1 Tax=Ziziphus jujuba var. spinosa TaxID=714518 RepID=A0A978W5J9_ZIZJJ|nr:hypothetical protein FEM48_Zijuj01G0288000 [Ziziphus jujuba var. spinosa]
MDKICCSIELEPRTLNQGQLNHVREVAADVVQKLEPHEASTLFVEGLRAVDSTKKMEQKIDEEVVVEFKEKTELIERPCQCACLNTNSETPVEHELKEPLSAPF